MFPVFPTNRLLGHAAPQSPCRHRRRPEPAHTSEPVARRRRRRDGGVGTGIAERVVLDDARACGRVHHTAANAGAAPDQAVSVGLTWKETNLGLRSLSTVNLATLQLCNVAL